MERTNDKEMEAGVQDYIGELLGYEAAQELFSALQNASKQELMTLQESLQDLFQLLQQNSGETLSTVV